MKPLIIRPRDKDEFNFFLELAKRLGVSAKTYDELQDEQLLDTMEKNRKTPKTDKHKIVKTLNHILNEKQEDIGNEQ